MRTLEYRVRGMCCAHEVAALKQAVGPVVGGEDRLAFDLLAGKMTVRADGADGEAVRRAVAATGMRAEPWEDRREGDPADEDRDGRRRRGAALAGSGLAALAGGLLDLGPVLLLAVALGLLPVLPRAWAAARRLRPDMNLLMTVAVLGAIVIGEWVEAASVAFLFALSLWLESWSVGRARRAVAALLDLSPPRARVQGADGSEHDVPVDEVAPGARVVVHPHERIPLDGEVLSGTSGVDQAPLTGESLPVDRVPGDEVFAGTINGEGVLVVRTTRPARDTVLARMVHRVAEAQARRAPVERWVDRFARVYTPVVMGLALATLLGPPLLLGAAWGPWIYRGLVLLVIACPCALVISTPVSLVAALAAAARQGVLVKGAAYLERAAEVRAVALDKTGTVTRGRPAVSAVETASALSPEDVLAVGAALAARSGHPLSRAVVEHARRSGLPVRPATGAREERGAGVRGTVDGRAAWIGSERMNALAAADAGRTAILVGDDRGVLGRIELVDELRPEAAAAVQELRAAGVAHVVLLTGDREAVAREVAAACGIAEVRAGLLPEGKVEAVERLVAEHGVTAVVGDGVNDAPALARADLGIAMAAAGSDAAVETADVALLADDLRRVPWLLRHARRTLGVVRVNIAFALGTKAVFALAAWAGYATLWGAIAADMGASLLVIANGLRLLGGKSR